MGTPGLPWGRGAGGLALALAMAAAIGSAFTSPAAEHSVPLGADCIRGIFKHLGMATPATTKRLPQLPVSVNSD